MVFRHLLRRIYILSLSKCRFEYLEAVGQTEGLRFLSSSLWERLGNRMKSAHSIRLMRDVTDDKCVAAPSSTWLQDGFSQIFRL